MRPRMTVLCAALFCAASVQAAARAADLDRRVAGADVVIVARIVRAEGPGPAACAVEEVLKGSLTAGAVDVDFAGLAPDRRPAAGQRRVLMLGRPAAGGPFVLQGAEHGLLPATLANIDEVIIAAEGASFASGAEQIGPKPVAETVPLPPRIEAHEAEPFIVPGRGPAARGVPEEAPPRSPAVETTPGVAPGRSGALDLPRASLPGLAPAEAEVPGGPSAKEIPDAPPAVPAAEAQPAAREAPEVGQEFGPEPGETPSAAGSREVTDDFRTRAAAADLVVSGRVISVDPPAGPRERARLLFAVEAVHKGAGAVPARLRVTVPRPAGEGPSWRPKRGRALLFAADGTAQGACELIHPLYGAESFDDEQAAGEILARLGRVEGLALPASAEERNSIAEVIAAWERAWNGKDLDGAIACYSTRSPLARAYALGGAARDRLRATLQAFPDRLAIAIGAVDPAGEGRARVWATLTQSRGMLRTSRRVEMLLVREDGRWRILREGF